MFLSINSCLNCYSRFALLFLCLFVCMSRKIVLMELLEAEMVNRKCLRFITLPSHKLLLLNKMQTCTKPIHIHFSCHYQIFMRFHVKDMSCVTSSVFHILPCIHIGVTFHKAISTVTMSVSVLIRYCTNKTEIETAFIIHATSSQCSEQLALARVGDSLTSTQ